MIILWQFAISALVSIETREEMILRRQNFFFPEKKLQTHIAMDIDLE